MPLLFLLLVAVASALGAAPTLTPQLSPSPPDMVRWSQDGALLASQGFDANSVTIWDAASGSVLRSLGPLQGAGGLVRGGGIDMAFTPAGDLVFVPWSGPVQVWDPRTGSVAPLAGVSSTNGSAAFSPDGTVLALLDPLTNQLTTVDLATGSVHRATAPIGPAVFVAVSRRGQVLVAGFGAAVVDGRTGAVVAVAKTDPVTRAGWSPAGDRAGIAGNSFERGWDGARFRGSPGGDVEWVGAAALRRSNGHVPWLDVAPDGARRIVTRWGRPPSSADVSGITGGDPSEQIQIAPAAGGPPTVLRSLVHRATLSAFTAGDEILLSTTPPPGGIVDPSASHPGLVWPLGGVPTPRAPLPPPPSSILAAAVPVFDLPGGDSFAGGPSPLLTRTDGTKVNLGGGPFPDVMPGAVTGTGRWAVGTTTSGATLLWDARTGTLAASLFAFRDGTWAVIDGNGRYDASNAGDLPGLHWVSGLEPIALAQLKERYYEPGLFGKIVGLNPEPVRSAVPLDTVQLAPGVEVTPRGRDAVGVKLSNRGGGLGRVFVTVNGKEIAADARAPGTDPTAATAELSVDVSALLVPGRDNRVEVRAYNAEGWLASRATAIVLPGPPARAKRDPHLWAVVAGVSDYAGDDLDLRFAAKDAQDFARALQIAAEGLFTTDRVHVTVLASGGTAPSRANVLAALDAIAGEAEPDDVLVIYLSGHGVNASGGYHYLTADARTGDLADPAVRDAVAVSTEALTDRIKAVAALKQLMILDTCASGAAIDDLVSFRAVPSTWVRALDRMKDRTGTYILAGSAADAVSYEASRYGQGLLTYSLLFGMRGPALQDGSVVDVSRLLDYATNRVPELAADIGGVQRPVLSAPSGASFAIGALDATAIAKIPLAEVRPVIVRASFQDEVDIEDTLGLTDRVNDRLREVSARGAMARIVFLDVSKYPDGARIVGRYRVGGDRVVVSAMVRSGETKTPIEVTGSPSDVEALAAAIVTQAEAVIAP